MQKIAIFGGTFNPIHKGHIKTALYFKDKLNLDKVIFIPTFIPPHKEMSEEIDPKIRFDMCCIETNKYTFFETSNIELLREGPSYTIDTLYELKKIYNDSKLYIIMGADMFLTIEKWKNHQEIFKLATICTVPRNNKNLEILLNTKKKLISKAECIIYNAPLIDISSSEIRKRIFENKNISGFVSKEIEQYIYKNKLYCEDKYEYRKV